MIDAQGLLDRLSKVDRSECDQALLDAIDGWSTRIAELESLRVVADTDFIKNLVSKFAEEIGQLESQLKLNRKLTELERLNIMDRRDLYQAFVDSFAVDKSLEKLAQEITENLC